MSDTDSTLKRPGRTGRPLLIAVPGARARPSMVPFVLLILGLLTAGLVTLLVLNTSLDAGSFTLTNLQKQQTQLAQTQEQLKEALEASANPSALASKAAQLGMVPDGGPVFLNPGNGAVLGVPHPATAPPTTAPPTTTATTTTPPASTTATTGGASPASLVIRPGTPGATPAVTAPTPTAATPAAAPPTTAPTTATSAAAAAKEATR